MKEERMSDGNKRNVGWGCRDISYDEFPILIFKTANDAIRHHEMYLVYNQPVETLTQPKVSEWIVMKTTWRIGSSVVWQVSYIYNDDTIFYNKG